MREMSITIAPLQQIAFVVLDPGRFPAVVHVLAANGQATIALLPSVAEVRASGLTPDEVARAMRIVIRERDRFLAAWQQDAPEVLRASGHATADSDEPRATGAAFDAPHKIVRLQLAGGTEVNIQSRVDPRLAAASVEQVADMGVIAEGAALHWRQLDYYVRVPDFILGAMGGETWRRALLAAGRPIFVWHLPIADWLGATKAASEPVAPAPAAIEGSGAPIPALVLQSGQVKSLLGLILYRERYVEQQVVQAIYQEQMRLREAGKEATFGQIALDAGHVTQTQLDFGLHLQKKLAHAPDGAKPLGVYLLESAAVMPSDLLVGLETQARTGQRLGEILIERGLITEGILTTFLAIQQARRPASPEPVPSAPAPESGQTVAPNSAGSKLTLSGAGTRSLLGIILERENLLTQIQVREIIFEQERCKKEGKNVTFGELALTLNFITADQLKFAIQLQSRLAYPPNKPKPLGFFFLENGVVKPSQLNIALEEATKKQRPLGEVLIEQGVLTERMVEVFLALQQNQNKT